MKILSPIIALFLPAETTLQVMMSIAIAFILLKTRAKKLVGGIKNQTTKSRNTTLENDVWAIE